MDHPVAPRPPQAGAVGKLDAVFGDVMPEDAAAASTLVPVESPSFNGSLEKAPKLLQ
jgi:hypothetical protein